MKQLDYVLIRTGQTPTLNLMEAEMYSAAVAVHQLIGNLVYYSNHGRYEPRLAESWQKTDPYTWIFKLHKNLVCENGEKITPSSFKRSLMRSIRGQEQSGSAVIFRLLRGFDAFIQKESDLEGIVATDDHLQFTFSEAIKDGLLESLSFAPYGYICEDNFEKAADGSRKWKDDLKFISSGPYKVDSIKPGKQIVLTKREDWVLPLADGAPTRVNIQYSLDEPRPSNDNLIVDVWVRKPKNLPSNLSQFKFVPEYMVSISLGNLTSGPFSLERNRLAFKKALRNQRQPDPEELATLTTSFYPGQNQGSDDVPGGDTQVSYEKGREVTILGEDWRSMDGRYTALDLIKATLKEIGFSYKFSGGPGTHAAISDQSIDIRVFSYAIGGEPTPWNINFLFCSPLSFNYPDPSGRVCKAIADYNEGSIDNLEFTKKFTQSVNEDAAILPLAHFGVNLFLSDSIDRDSLSPLISVVRFDQVRMR